MTLSKDDAVAAFLSTFPPSPDNVPVDPGLIDAFRDRLPTVILELWQQGGFGLYGDGEIQVIDPRDYEQNLWGWLMREDDDPSRTPIALSAFGVMFYHRRLDEEVEDIAYLDPHTSEGDVLAYSSIEFIGRTIVDAESREILLQKPLFEAAREKRGPLVRGTVFGFVPALRLGGEQSVSRTEALDARVHLDLLLQLALDD
jgi:hypothetical protein